MAIIFSRTYLVLLLTKFIIRRTYYYLIYKYTFNIFYNNYILKELSLLYLYCFLIIVFNLFRTINGNNHAFPQVNVLKDYLFLISGSRFP